MKGLLLSLGLGVLATVSFFVVGGLFSGGGHSLVAINFFFPYSGIVGPSLKDTRWEFVSMILLLAQFPVYALLVSYSARRRFLVAIVLLFLHAVAAVAALRIYDASKPRSGPVQVGAVEQIVAREPRERVSHQTWSGDAFVKSRGRVNSTVSLLN